MQRDQDKIAFAVNFYLWTVGGDVGAVSERVEAYYDFYYETHRKQPVCRYCGREDFKLNKDGKGPCGCV